MMKFEIKKINKNKDAYRMYYLNTKNNHNSLSNFHGVSKKKPLTRFFFILTSQFARNVEISSSIATSMI